MRNVIGVLSSVALVMLLAGIGQAQVPFERQFAVDIIVTSPGFADQGGTLYVGDRMIRMDMEEAGEEIAMILDFTAEVMTMRMVMPAEMMYVEMSMDVAEFLESDDMDLFFAIAAPDHPDHPCQTFPERVDCRHVGSEQVNGVQADRWEIEVTDEAGDVWAQTLWFDPEEVVVVRLEYDDGNTVHFRDYRFGPQPAELFEVPEGYERFELPPGMPFPGN